MSSADNVIKETEKKMKATLEFLQKEFAGLRTGMASSALVENIKVNYYGANVRLKEIANISIPESRVILIHPYDPSSLSGIEKSILASNIGLTPINDGKCIRLVVPELSEERRKELVKIAKRIAEDARVAIRNERRDGNEKIKQIEKNKEISEDDKIRFLDQIQKMTENYIKRIDELLATKEKEILTT